MVEVKTVGIRISALILLAGPVFPASPDSLFMPAHENNLWIMEHSRYQDSPDTSVHWVESETIEGRPYWRWKADPAYYDHWWDPFRLDGKGNIWIRNPREEIRTSAVGVLDRFPVLRDSLRSFSLGSLDTVYHDMLLFDFDAPDSFRDDDFGGCSLVIQSISLSTPASISPESLAGVFYYFYFGLIWRSYDWSICETPHYTDPEYSKDERLYLRLISGHSSPWMGFSRGLGLTRMGYERDSVSLIWARIDGKEHGTHPGTGYPGYTATSTPVSSWGTVKANQAR